MRNVPPGLRPLLHARRHTVLLLSIIGLFAIRPLLGDTGASAMVFSLAIFAVVFAALVTIHAEDMVGDTAQLLAQRRRRILVGLMLAVPAIAERVWLFYEPNPSLILVGTVSWLIFFSYVTWSQARNLLKHREVTGEIVSLSISIYLLLGVCWALLYIVIFTWNPASFSLQVASGVSEQHAFPIFIYFSLTCLSTIGFGDITPLTLPSRYAAVAEGIVGQLYLAILVARIVGLQMSQAAKSPEDGADRDAPQPATPDR